MIETYDRIEKVTMISRDNFIEHKDVYILTGDNVENNFEIDITFMNFINNYYIIKREYIKGVKSLNDILDFTHDNRIDVPLKLDRDHELFWVDNDGWCNYAVAFNLELLGEYEDLKELGWI